MSESNHITWHDSEVTKKQRQQKMDTKVLLYGLQGYLGQGNQRSLLP